MSTFPQILPMAGRETPQKGDSLKDVPAAAAELAGQFADVMAMALSPVPKENVALTNQKSVETDGKNPERLEAKQTIEDENRYNNEISAKQIAAANVLNTNSSWPEVGMQKPEAQLNALHSNSIVANESDGKSSKSTKTDKNSQSQTEQVAVGVIPAELPINQMIADAVSSVNLIPRTLPRPETNTISHAPKQTGMDEGSLALRIVSVASKPISGVPTILADTLENETAAEGKSPEVSTVVPTTREVMNMPATDTPYSSFSSTTNLLSETKPNFHSGHQPIPEPTSTVRQPTPEASSELNGIPVAKQDISVKQADKMNHIAGQTEKVLPGKTVLAAEGYSRLSGSVHMEQVAATVPATNQAPSNLSAGATPVQAASNGGVGGLERTQEMITVNAVRLSDSGNNAMQVVIKPDAGTQLSLELRQHGTSVEVQAVLQQGNFNHLSQQWSDLQQRLTQRGIQLAPLADDAATAHNAGSESFQQKQQQATEQAAELPIASLPTGQVSPTITRAPLIAHMSGWETWA